MPGARGARLSPQKAEDGWTLVCLSHGTENPQPSRGAVWKAAAHQEEWCAKWNAIAAGKADKITDGLLPIPTTTKKAAPRKAATRKRATAKGKGRYGRPLPVLRRRRHERTYTAESGTVGDPPAILCHACGRTTWLKVTTGEWALA